MLVLFLHEFVFQYVFKNTLEDLGAIKSKIILISRALHFVFTVAIYSYYTVLVAHLL